MKQFYRQRRILLIILLFMLLFSFHAYSLFYLQLLSGSALAEEAVNQRTPGLVLDSGRGDILDRHGTSLLDSSEKEVLAAFPFIYRDNMEEVRQVLRSPELINKISEKAGQNTPFVAKKASTLSLEGAGLEGSGLEGSDINLPGLVPVEKEIRYGPGSLAHHAVGYVQRDSGRGVYGVEALFDEYLAGDDPSRLVAPVDAKNNFIEGLGYRLQESSGVNTPRNVVLTIDNELQKAVEEIMDKLVEVGAVVVTDPSNGDLLAVASRPHFDPLHVEDYLDDGERHPMINRAVYQYQPGSVFKTVLAAAALEEGTVSLYEPVGDKEIFKEAMAHSCNPSFMTLAEKLGWEKIRDYALAMGAGEETGWPLFEKTASIPGPDIDPAELDNKAIGQGSLEVTPLEIARMMSVIANDGVKRELRLVKKIENEAGRAVRYYSPSQGNKVLSSSTANQLKYMLQAVTDYGTGTQADIPGTSVGGKTGTAASTGRWRNEEEITNYWFVGMVPLESSRAVIVVFMEEPGASLVFREVGQAFLDKNQD